MIVLRTLAISFVLTALLLQGILQNVAQKHEPEKNIQDNKVASNVEDPKPFTTLGLEFDGPEESVLSLQPIPVVLRLTNPNNLPALGYKAIGFGKSPLYVYVKKSGASNKTMIRGLTPLATYNAFGTNVPMEPGETIIANEWITLGLKKYFPEPGRYELQAVMANADGKQFIESNVITVEIRQPIGPERLAFNLIRDSSFQEYLFSGLEFDRVRSTLERLTNLYPNSPYTRSASFVLGENHFYDRRFAQALANLIRLEHDNNFIFAERVRNYLAEIRRINLNQPAQSEKP